MSSVRAQVFTFGETMGLVTSPPSTPLRHASHLELRIGGAESNTAIGMARLGHSVKWTGRVGDDELGRLIVTRLRGEDVDVSGVVVDDSAPTGLMLRGSRSPGQIEVTYYRKGSAGSRLASSDFDEESITGAQLLYLTGITPALSPNARQACLDAIETATGITTIVFDPNFRSKLWSRDEAAPVLSDMARRADIVLCGLDELELLVSANVDNGPRELIEAGVRELIVRNGSAEIVSFDDDGRNAFPLDRVDVVDPIGAGDGFAAGYMSGSLEGLQTGERVDRATRVAAAVVSSHGDWEGLPLRSDLHRGDDYIVR